MEFWENSTLGALTVGKANLKSSSSFMYSSSLSNKKASFCPIKSALSQSYCCLLTDCAWIRLHHKLSVKTRGHREFSVYVDCGKVVLERMVAFEFQCDEIDDYWSYF